MKTKLFAGTLLATMMTLGMSQAVVAGPPGHANGGGGGNGSDETCDLNHDTHFCTEELRLIDYELISATLSNESAREKLRTKVCSADLKLHVSKPGDALMKLDDLRATIEALRDAPKEKIDDYDANEIIKEIDLTKTCITDNWASF